MIRDVARSHSLYLADLASVELLYPIPQRHALRSSQTIYPRNLPQGCFHVCPAFVTLKFCRIRNPPCKEFLLVAVKREDAPHE